MLLFSEKAIIEVVTGTVGVALGSGLKAIWGVSKDLYEVLAARRKEKFDAALRQSRIFIPEKAEIDRIQKETADYQASVEARLTMASIMRKNPCIILAMVLLGSVVIAHAGGLVQDTSRQSFVYTLVLALLLDVLLRQFRNRDGHLLSSFQ